MRAPGSDTVLIFGEFFAENLLVDNADLNGDAAVQYWGSCIGNVLAGHLSRNCQVLWYWTFEDAQAVNPIAFSEAVNCRFTDRGAIWLTVKRNMGEAAPTPGPLCFGNLFSSNQIADFRERPGNQYWPYWLNPGYAPQDYAAIMLAGRSPQAGRGLCHSVFGGDEVPRGPVAVRLPPGTYGNVFRRVRVDGTERPVVDGGERNLVVEQTGQQ